MNLALLTLITISSTSSGPVEATVSIEPAVIPYHRQAVLTLSVECPAGLEVTFPDIATLLNGVSAAGPPQAPEITELRGGRQRISVSHRLDAIWPGDYPLKPATFTYGDGEKLTVPGPVLRVRELTEAETELAMQFAPNDGPIDPRFHLAKAWWFRFAVGAAALSAFTALFLFIRRRPSATAQAPLLPPWEAAYARLRALDAQRLPAAGLHEPYYVELSAILREYIENRFHLRAPEETTPEFLAEAAESGRLTQAHQQLLAHFLRHCDRVKFAQHIPSVAEMESGMVDVLQFIDETAPSQDPADQEAAA